MQYIIDSANVKEIRRCVEFFPIDGVTTNPTIISSEKTDFIELIKSIRDVIGMEKMFHIQTTSTETEKIIREAETLRSILGPNFYIKIPITTEGIKATMELAHRGVNVTVTAIFTQQQALIAAKAGAKYVAPYVNRLDNIVSDGVHVVEEIVDLFRLHNIQTKVLAASFKTIEQIHKIGMVGAHAITLTPDLYEKLTFHPLTTSAIKDFQNDWKSVYGDKTILDLIN